MAKKNSAMERLSIDVLPEEHRQIKAYAALYGKTIREYVLECVQKLKEGMQKQRSDDEKHDAEMAKVTTPVIDVAQSAPAKPVEAAKPMEKSVDVVSDVSSGKSASGERDIVRDVTK